MEVGLYLDESRCQAEPRHHIPLNPKPYTLKAPNPKPDRIFVCSLVVVGYSSIFLGGGP